MPRYMQIDVLNRAKDYLEKLRDGTDPISGQVLPDFSAAQERDLWELFSHCVQNLNTIISYDGLVERPPFSITPQQQERLKAANGTVEMQDLIKRINWEIDLSQRRGLNRVSLFGWLTDLGCLQPTGNAQEYVVTGMGQTVGIGNVESFEGKRRVVFRPEGQKFVLERLQELSRWCQGHSPKEKKSKNAVKNRGGLEQNLRGMERLAQGLHPVTCQPLAGGDPLRQERLQKCFAFTAKSLRRTLEVGYFTAKTPFRLPPELCEKIVVTQEPVTLGVFLQRVNALLPDPTAMQGLSATELREYLSRQGVLQKLTNERNHTIWRPSANGRELGIEEAEGISKEGEPFTYVTYGLTAQQYLASCVTSL